MVTMAHSLPQMTAMHGHQVVQAPPMTIAGFHMPGGLPAGMPMAAPMMTTVAAPHPAMMMAARPQAMPQMLQVAQPQMMAMPPMGQMMRPQFANQGRFSKPNYYHRR